MKRSIVGAIDLNRVVVSCDECEVEVHTRCGADAKEKTLLVVRAKG